MMLYKHVQGVIAPTTQKSPQDGSSTTTSNVHALRGDGCRLSLDRFECVFSFVMIWCLRVVQSGKGPPL